jgi:hypothetical protein
MLYSLADVFGWMKASEDKFLNAAVILIRRNTMPDIMRAIESGRVASEEANAQAGLTTYCEACGRPLSWDLDYLPDPYNGSNDCDYCDEDCAEEDDAGNYTAEDAAYDRAEGDYGYGAFGGGY